VEKKRSRQKVQKRIWGFWSKEKIRTKSGGPKKKNFQQKVYRVKGKTTAAAPQGDASKLQGKKSNRDNQQFLQTTTPTAAAS